MIYYVEMASPAYANFSPLFPNPLVCAKDYVVYGFNEINVKLPWNGIGPWWQETLDWMQIAIRPDLNVIIWPMIICVLLTVLRIFLNRILFRVSCLSRHFRHCDRPLFCPICFAFRKFRSGLNLTRTAARSFRRASGNL